MNKIMLSCVKATELIELKEKAPLSFMEKMQLRMHISMCSGCRNYMKQTHLIDLLLEKTFTGVPFVENTDELEAAIISNLE